VIVSKTKQNADQKKGKGTGENPYLAALLAVILVLALVGVVVSYRLNRGGPKPAKALPTQEYSVRCAALGAEADQLTQSIQTRLKIENAPLPMEPLKIRQAAPIAPPAVKASSPVEVKKEATLRVTGVALSGPRPMVFVNDKTLEIGESMDGFKVIGVESDGVTFLDPQGQKRSIPLYTEPKQ